MNLPETAELLAFAQAFDQRTVGRADVIAWQGVLVDAPFEDCHEAVRRHYTEHTERLMPAHVLRILGEIGAERARAARKWAPGQYGVAAGEAYPEISGPIDDSNMPEDVKTRLRELLTERFGPSDREALRPRTVAWEREHKAYVRVREQNPLYRPAEAVSHCPDGYEGCQPSSPCAARTHWWERT